MAKENKKNDIRSLTVDELSSKAKELREQLFRMKLQKNVGQLADTSSLKKSRKMYAQILTFMTQKNNAAKTASKKTKSATK